MQTKDSKPIASEKIQGKRNGKSNEIPNMPRSSREVGEKYRCCGGKK